MPSTQFDPLAAPGDRWALVSRLFFETSHRPIEEWDSYLRGAIGPDDTLVDEVLGLLREDRKSDVVHEIVAERFRELDRRTHGGGGLEVGQKVAGSYTILAEIGHGGMGTVYRARRDLAGVGRTVAVKVIRPGMASELVIRRFGRESRLLAALDHPNIARLMDVGTTDAGLPLLVMEYVEGRPIDEHCRREQLGTARIVSLVLRVCDAVQHAHRNLVVHRDLKPSNVLVRPDGTPCLLDFGLAKLLEPAAVEDEVVTLAGHNWMTPEYASPEQACSGAVTTSTDVFGLGSLLYRLLTGLPPFRFASRSPLEIARVLTEVEPEPPSRRARSPLPAPAEESGPVPSGLAVPVDLDHVVLKALAKDPAERYGSAGDLARDLRRFLDGRPVRARHWTWRYRSGRWLARHRRWAAVLLPLLLLACGSLAAHLRQAEEADRLRRQVELESARGLEVADFLVDLFDRTDRDLRRHDELLARELVDRGLARARVELGDRPVLQLMIFNAMSRSYRRLGELGAGEDLALEALDLGRGLLGDRSWALRNAGETEEPIAIRRREAVTFEISTSLHELGLNRLESGEPARARTCLRLALAMREQSAQDRSLAIAETLDGLIGVHSRVGEGRAALDLASRRLRILSDLFGGRHVETAVGRADLGAMEAHFGDARAALQHLESAIPVLERELGPDSLRLASARHHFGQALLWQGKPREARDQLEASRIAYTRIRGPDHPWVAIAAATSSQAALELGEHDRAEELLHESLAILRAAGSSRLVEAAIVEHDLGRVALARGDLEAARRLLEGASAVLLEVQGRDHPESATVGHSLAVLARRQARRAEAEETFEWVLGVRRQFLGPTHRRLASTLHELGILRLEQGRPLHARELLEEALEIRRRGLRRDHPEIAQSLCTLGELDLEHGRFPSGIERLERAACILRTQAQEVRDGELADRVRRALVRSGRSLDFRCSADPGPAPLTRDHR